jgi:hypothetical protein
MAYTNNLIPVLSSNTSYGIASASTEFSTTYAAWEAFDNVTANYWKTTTVGVAPCTLVYQWFNWTFAKAITQYTITSNAATDSPKTWKFQGSNDGTTWTDLDTQTDITVWGINEKKTYSFANTTVYMNYRLSISANNGATTTAITAFEIMATIATDIQVAGESLQVEFDGSQVAVAGISMQVEFAGSQVAVAGISMQVEMGIPGIQVAGVSMQVEIDIPIALEITAHTTIIEILEYKGTGIIDTIPDTETMILTAPHGLVVGDFFVNKTVRDMGVNGMYNTERGSRRVLLQPDTVEIGYNGDIADASPGDEILLFKFTDITSYLLQKTLSITKNASHNNSANCRLKLPVVAGSIPFQPHPGQLIRITLDDDIRFFGLIADLFISGVHVYHPFVYQDIQCIGLKGIPSRRTITVNYASTDYSGDIVATLNDTFLVQEGFTKALPAMTNIDQGAILGESWQNDIITVAEAFDELASKNGYQWFVDDEFSLHFYQDPVTVEDAPYNISSGGILKIRDLSLSHSIDNYVNKNFVVGGKDADGNQIKTVNVNLAQQNAIQLITGGTGVWGNVLRDSAISRVIHSTSEAGTAFFTVNLTAHGLVVGDYVWNDTLGMTFWVASVPTLNSFTVNETAFDQAPGDSIITYPSADDASLNILKKQGFMPKIVEYTIDHIFINPQMKQTIELPMFGIVLGTYNIDSVVIKDNGAGLYESRITAVLRDTDNFSTQQIGGYTDYFRGF